MAKRIDPCFWKGNSCPECNYYTPLIYTPDLLTDGVTTTCPNCCHTWTVELKTIEEINDLLHLIDISRRQDTIWEEYVKNRTILGYR